MFFYVTDVISDEPSTPNKIPGQKIKSYDVEEFMKCLSFVKVNHAGQDTFDLEESLG